MTTLETVKEMIYNHNASTAKKRTLYLAYIMLHMENPGMHPDDHLNEDGPYKGYQVILAEEVLTRNAGSVPDNFEYPCSFLKLEDTLNTLNYYHDDLVENSCNPMDEVKANGLLQNLNEFSCWLQDMKPKDLEEAVVNLQALYDHHHSATDTEEEEGEKPAGILKDCLEVLIWIQQFSR
jgi:hypothetical protein